MQFLVEHIRRVMTGPDSQDRRDGFREELLLASAPRPVDEMWAELQRVVGELGDPHLRALLERVTAAHEASLKIWPAARAVHHAYRGGLLEHILSMARAGRMLADLYGASPDLVVAGAVLHDIGKLQELDYGTTTTYTRDGNLIGHITLGAMLVHDACRDIRDFPDSLRSQVLHLIASHHGERELGSPVEPLSLEAFILAAVDELDARVNQIKRAIGGDESVGEFTSYHSRLGRVLWKGDA
jgi:3'-5' exoribonuclease